jgi:LytS/YehU family sensor histidine kinase
MRYKGEPFIDDMIFYLTSGTLAACFYSIYYKLLLPFLLFKKKYLYFIMSVLLFIIVYDVYLRLIDWSIYKLPFIQSDVRALGKINMKLAPRQMFSLTLEHLVVLTALGILIKNFREEMDVRKLKEKHLQLELDYLKAHMRPHFFFNSLNNIYGLALEESKETAPTVVKLSELMRYIIYDCTEEKVPLEKEIAFLKNFIELEQIRHKKDIDISFIVQGKAGNKWIEPLLFIVLIENAFKHGIKASGTGAWVSVALTIFDTEIILEITNSKPRLQNNTPHGVGLENLRKRLDLLYPQKHSLTIKNTDNSFEVYLNLQLHEHIQMSDSRRRARSAANY